MSGTPRKFSFDTSFDDQGAGVSSPPLRKAFYAAYEIDHIRAEAYEEGRTAALGHEERLAAERLEELRQSIRHAMAALAQAAHDHRTGSAALALAAARKIADAALDQFPRAPLQAALEALSREVEAQPRLMVGAPADAVDTLKGVLDEMAAQAGYAGQVTVRADPGLRGASFVFDWGEGRAAFDPEQSALRVAAALEAALASEGLHAEALSSTPEVIR